MDADNLSEEINKINLTVDCILSKAIKNISSINKNERLDSFKTIKTLIVPEDPEEISINKIISYGLIPILIEHLKDTSDKEIQIECALSLNCLTLAETLDENGVSPVQHLIENELHLISFDLLSTSIDNSNLLEQILNIVGNLSMNSSEFRDYIMDQGIIIMLENILSLHIDKMLIITLIIFSTLNSYGLESPPSLSKNIKSLLQIIKKVLLENSDDQDISTYSINSLTCLMNNHYSERIKELIVGFGFIDILVKIVGSTENNEIKKYGLESIGNMLVILDNDKDKDNSISSVDSELFMVDLLLVLSNNIENPLLILYVFRVLSCITSSSSIKQIQLLINSELLLKSMEIGMGGTVHDGEGVDDEDNEINEIKIEILWVIIGAISNCGRSQIIYFLKNHIIQFFQVNFKVAKLDDELFKAFLNSIALLLSDFELLFTTPSISIPKVINLYNNTIKNSFIQSIQSHKTDKFADGFDELLKNLNSILELVNKNNVN